ncbi:TolC family protein [Gluconobacter frateurii]|uniref:Cobalt/zinc/cadmium resistance heavy metal efflux pump protein n=1 Tax=Gluconobacter frateurii NRIC 0228 TaxID=1307946 RepID=A0ABQ0QEV1_9PROT|nr:TolC family protein [Gluconobacter frateurii]GBR16639.1 cobalt/zinc/cadmium resistance heavy metal efflux pump protein [Gluconobacter frateurii NRIC 0228]
MSGPTSNSFLKGRRYGGSVLGLAALLICAPAHGQTSSRDISISVHEAITDAWNNDPVRTELQTNQQSADARAKAAQSWFAGGPTLSADYYDDRIGGSHLGYITWQGGVSVPLWLPGQGTATENVAHADARTALIRLDVERMAVAVRVVDAAGAAILARKRETAAQATLSALERISSAVSRAVRAGESGSVDSQAVTAQLADARSELEGAREEIFTSRAALQTLLGVDGIPDITQADRRWLVLTRANNLRWVEDDDPRVRAAHEEVIAAQAQVRLARASFMPNPEVGVDAIDQAQYGSPWDTQVGFNVRVPLPNAVTTTPVTSAARDRLAAASRQEIQARRAVQNEMAQVRARVEAATTTLDDARVSASAMLRRADAMEHSWRLGESPLIEALRARTDAYRSLLALNRAEIAWHGAIIRIGIATGTMP